MTITQTAAYIKSHPFYALALTDEEAMDKLLFEIIFHTYSTVACNCAKAFRQNKRRNAPEILEAIRDIEPPCNLDIRLPIPEVGCLVVSMKNPALISGAGEELEEG